MTGREHINDVDTGFSIDDRDSRGHDLPWPVNDREYWYQGKLMSVGGQWMLESKDTLQVRSSRTDRRSNIRGLPVAPCNATR
jgi:hypothetical protein